MAQAELEITNSSSDDEEEVSSEASESESESEMTPPPPPSSKVTQATPQSSSDESESDADSPPKMSEKADPNIKPLASKPMDDEPSRKPRPKNPTARYSPPSVKPLNGKRKAAEVDDEAVESKIQKEAVTVAVPGPGPGPENAGEKKPLFQRLWSEEDEIELIKGMIGYVEEKGREPISDVNDFHEFVKSSLNVDVNNGQMTAKVKRLKAKFMNNVGKIEQNGKVRSLSNPHEKKMYELSEKLWGKIRNSNKNPAMVSCSTKKANPKPKADQKQKGNSNFVVSSEANVNGGLESGEHAVHHSTGGIRFPITEEGIMNRALELASGDKKAELEAKWNDLKMQEFKHYLKKVEFMKEQGELVFNAIKKSGASK